MSSSFIIVGAGISGLTTAWFLRRQGHQVKVLEKRAQAGGNLRSLSNDGYLIEQGPNSLLNSRPALPDLFRGLDIEPQKAASEARKRYVLRDGRLHPLPMGPGDFIRTPLFSAKGKLRLLAEPFIGRAAEEESLARFVERRLGREFLDWAINPFVSGVYAGDPEQLSVRAATARVYALERDYGSLIRGALAKTLFHRHRGGAGPGGEMISFAGGMQALSECLATSLGTDLELDSPVEGLEAAGNGWAVRANEQRWEAEHLVLALPADSCATLLEPLAPTAASELDSILYPGVASVSLGFARDQVEHPLDGFGFLVPRCTGVETLGVLFPSSVFPERAPPGHCLLTAFIGGALNPGICTLDPEEVRDRVLRDIRPLLGIQGEPLKVEVSLWPRAIPQYRLGHLQRLETIDAALSARPGLWTRANWRDGISVADCIQNAADFAARFQGTGSA